MFTRPYEVKVGGTRRDRGCLNNTYPSQARLRHQAKRKYPLDDWPWAVTAPPPSQAHESIQTLPYRPVLCLILLHEVQKNAIRGMKSRVSSLKKNLPSRHKSHAARCGATNLTTLGVGKKFGEMLLGILLTGLERLSCQHVYPEVGLVEDGVRTYLRRLADLLADRLPFVVLVLLDGREKCLALFSVISQSSVIRGPPPILTEGRHTSSSANSA